MHLRLQVLNLVLMGDTQVVDFIVQVVDLPLGRFQLPSVGSGVIADLTSHLADLLPQFLVVCLQLCHVLPQGWRLRALSFLESLDLQVLLGDLVSEPNQVLLQRLLGLARP